MIYEFAVDPGLPAAWAGSPAFHIWRDYFGVGTPRAVTLVPSKPAWRTAAAIAAQQLEGLQQTRAVALAQRIIDESSTRRIIAPAQAQWLPVTLQEHRRREFAAIFCTEAVAGVDRLFVNSTLPPDHPACSLPAPGPVDRTAAAFVARLSNLLRLSRKIIFVDPNLDFHAPRERFSRPLLAMIHECYRDRDEPPVTVTLVTKEFEVRPGSTAPPVTAADHKFRSLNSSDGRRPAFYAGLPPAARICVVVVRQRPNGQKLHDRFVLGNLGGVQFSVGLDEGRQGETDTANLLQRATYEKTWSEYDNNLAGFDIVDSWWLNRNGLAPRP